MKKWLFVGILTALSIVLAACGKDSGTAASGEEDNVINYQVYRSVLNPVDLAVELGYLDGIKMNGVGDYKGGTESIQLVGTGEVDVGWAFNGALIKAQSKNVDLVSVLGNYGSDEVTNVSIYVLEDSSIKEPKDFIGKKVGVNILGAHADIIMQDYLAKGGLTSEEIAKVQLVVIPTPNAEQALRAGQLDAAMFMGASEDLAIARGGVREVFNDVDVIGKSFTAGNYFFSQKFVDEKPELVKKFTEGIAKTIEWSKETPQEEVIATMEKIIKERNPNESTENLKYWKSFGVATEGGIIQDEDIQIWIDWLENNGEIEKGSIKASDIYTNEFNPYAK
jgi:ABC-type nitrate/sulfonate/bicarbonate transport system substrate-binding protein